MQTFCYVYKDCLISRKPNDCSWRQACIIGALSFVNCSHHRDDHLFSYRGRTKVDEHCSLYMHSPNKRRDLAKMKVSFGGGLTSLWILNLYLVYFLHQGSLIRFPKCHTSKGLLDRASDIPISWRSHTTPLHLKEPLRFWLFRLFCCHLKVKKKKSIDKSVHLSNHRSVY